MRKKQQNSKKQVGIRLGWEAFQELEFDAREYGISPTSRARQIITDHFGLEDCSSVRAPRRSQNKPDVTPQMQDIANALCNLMSVQMNLRNLTAYYKHGRANAGLEPEAFVQTSLTSLQRDVSAIKKAVLEAAR
ncbi:hypothetical protein [Shimia thalassica]|uniref:hypothetical protein n=1 Tax=Shimia thalassica TaxID=1715693 RepID=UPI0026E411C2|nr:hypothetical protein [Shimia thalassica]MDO6481876.1 hypothetical protein [Shimia thalassica]